MRNEYCLKDRMSIPVPIPVFENEYEKKCFMESIKIEDLENESFDFDQYISPKKLKKAEAAPSALVKTTIKIYELNNKELDSKD